METFKDIERENKTKPHSKQGLSAEDKLDPKEKEKADAIEWFNVSTFATRRKPQKSLYFSTRFGRFKTKSTGWSRRLRRLCLQTEVESEARARTTPRRRIK